MNDEKSKFSISFNVAHFATMVLMLIEFISEFIYKSFEGVQSDLHRRKLGETIILHARVNFMSRRF